MQTIKMDFQSQSTPPVVPVMQSDSQSRFIGIALYDGGVPYEAPEGASYTVQYRGPGANNMGWYDTIQLSSGTRKAVIVDSASKNVITLELAEQALRVNGNVFVNLCVVTNTGYMLKTFPILCRVTGAAFPDTVAVQSFFYVTGITSEQWLAYVTACQDAQKRAEAAAATFETDPTLSVSGKAADAKATGTAVNAIKYNLNEYINYDNNMSISFNDTNGNSNGTVASKQMYIVNKAFGKVLLRNITFNPTITSITHIYLFERENDTLKLVKDIIWNTIALGTASSYTMPINQSFNNLMIGMRNDKSSEYGAKYNTGKLTYGFLIYDDFVDGQEFNIKNTTVFEQGSLQIGAEYLAKYNSNKGYIIVSTNGDGDYTTITEAINNANGNPIYIKNGIYDEEIKCDNEEITLIGQDKYRTIIRAKNGLYGHDPIYLSRGYLENITFYSQYVKGESTEIGNNSGAYAVHLDSSYQYNGGSILFNNCRLISDFAPALGSGLRGNFTAEFLNCEFISNQNGIGYKHNEGGVGAVYVHNDHTGKPIQAKQKITLKNCICKAHMKNVLYLLTVHDNNTSDVYAEFESINTVYYSGTNGTENIVVNNGTGVWHYSKLNHGNNVELI